MVSDPQARISAAATSELIGVQAGGTRHYRLLTNLELGDQLSRAALTGQWRADPSLLWRWQVDPSVEFRDDQTFDRDRQELRATLGARLRRTALDGTTYGELRLGGDLLRTHGEQTAFLLDRQTATVGLSLEHADLGGADWHLGWAGVARAFPDSSERDHLEQAGDVSWHRMFEGGHVLDLRVLAIRRHAVHVVDLTRDDFWNQDAGADWTQRLSTRWSVLVGGGLEAMQYDAPDSVVYFDYRIVRSRLGMRAERARGGTATASLVSEIGDDFRGLDRGDPLGLRLHRAVGSNLLDRGGCRDLAPGCRRVLARRGHFVGGGLCGP